MLGLATAIRTAIIGLMGPGRASSRPGVGSRWREARDARSPAAHDLLGAPAGAAGPHIDVPVEREEVVIERRPASGRAARGDIREEEIVVPVKEERVSVTKQPVVTEEVSVGRRKVRETKHVSETVRKEDLKVAEEGDVKVKGRGRSGT